LIKPSGKKQISSSPALREAASERAVSRRRAGSLSHDSGATPRLHPTREMLDQWLAVGYGYGNCPFRQNTLDKELGKTPE